jgi:hypothetical protein
MTASSRPARARLFIPYIALPQDHGSWVFLFSPLLVGLLAAPRLTLAAIPLILGALAAFLLRQPLTILIKVQSGRRAARDRTPALFWAALYTVVGLLAALWLGVSGYAWLLWLAVPGAPVFLWHLWLVGRRAERRQIGVELVATGVLSLAAPAAYWIGSGWPDPTGWLLFGLTWFQAAASIVYAYLRLEQRAWPAVPDRAKRFQAGRRALLYTGFNLAAVTALALLRIAPPLTPLPFAIQFAETLHGALIQPAVAWKPTRIGLRQLMVSSLFTLTLIVAFLWP